jgi:hypothetical protein
VPRLERHGLVCAFDLGMIGGAALADKGHIDAQGQQPQMQAGRERRGVVVKDRAMIEGDAPGQAHRQESASQHQLIGFRGGIGRLEAGIALDFEATHDINNGDQTDFAHSCHLHATDAASSSHSSCGAPCGWIAGVGRSLCF